MARTKVFINGCFDLFHDGHKHLFKTVLDTFRDSVILVAINTDYSIKEMKGNNRPSVSLLNRCDAIQRFVDEWCCANMEYPGLIISPFDTEEKLECLMEEFEPDVIVKGNDRELKDIKGSDKWPVFVVPRLKNSKGDEISTTNILERGYEK